MSLSSGVGGGRGRDRSRGHGLGGVDLGHGFGGVGSSGLEDPSPRHPGLHCHCEMAMPLGNQTPGTMANLVMISIAFIFIYVLTLLMQNL
jgi:hypothetical protein